MDDSFITSPLAGYAGTCAWQCLAPTSWDGFPTVFAMLEALASWHPRAGAADRITYSVINLILYRAIARPSSGHNRFHSFSLPDVGTRSVWFNARSSLRPATASWRWQGVASSATTAVRFVSACRPASQCRAPSLPLAWPLQPTLCGRSRADFSRCGVALLLSFPMYKAGCLRLIAFCVARADFGQDHRTVL